MSEKRIFEVGYIEYPKTSLIYRSLKIDISNYPELQDKEDDDIVEYIKQNAWNMKSVDEDYTSLGEELQQQDIIREKVPHVDYEVWAEVLDVVDSYDEDEDDEDEDYGF